MKKTIILLLCMLVVLSCSDGLNIVDNQESAGVPMTFKISVDDINATKAVKSAWIAGDKIYVFFNGLETKFVILEYDGNDWNETFGNDPINSNDYDWSSTKTLTAVHFPMEVTVSYANGSFSFANDGKPIYNFYLFDSNKEYIVDGTTVTAHLTMGKPADMVQFHIEGIQASIDDYTFGCSKVKPVACKSVGVDGTITESILQAGVRLSGIPDEDGGIFGGRLTKPNISSDYIFTLASDDYIYTLTRTNKKLTAGKMYNFPALSETGAPNWIVTDVSDLYVDLGLSVMWAKCNLGANIESDYGDYFSWGETTGTNEDKANYAMKYYLFASETNGLYFTKYTLRDDGWDASGTADGLRRLQQKYDDAAYAALGGKFRMATMAEQQELHNNCTWTWTTQNGVNGYLVTSKVEGFTDRSIFLPAAGCFGGASINDLNDDGSYWSSELYNVEMAWNINFIGTEGCVSAGGSRNHGHSVRPVRPSEGWLSHISLELDRNTLTIVQGKQYGLSVDAKYDGNDYSYLYYGFKWYSDNPLIATVDDEGVITAVSNGIAHITAMLGTKSVECTVTVTDTPEGTSVAVPEYVDLGLSVKWATFNVGATKPEEYGAYFSWGEIEKKNDYSWTTYHWCNGSSNTLTKYNTSDGLGDVDSYTVLSSADDVAQAKWGGDWRMPTENEMNELLDNCKWTWTRLNGTNGYLVTSMVAGYTSQSIFLPAAGRRIDQHVDEVGSTGYYWTSSLFTEISYYAMAVTQSFPGGSVSKSPEGRRGGISVRPVCP